jgi:multiple sugar transport system substrate-binding protein
MAGLSSLRAGRLAPLLAALVVSGCGGAQHGEVLKFWAFGAEADQVSVLLPAFEREHPGLHVEVQRLALTAAHEKFLTAVAGDATPDMCQLGNSWIPELVALHALEPLQLRVAASKIVDVADFFPQVWQANSLDGVPWGVPWYVDTRLLFYRSDLLRQAGFAGPADNWADWLRQLQAIKRMVGPQRYALLLPLNEFEPLQVLALQQPEAVLRAGNRYGNFRSASFRRALGFYHELFEQSLAPQATNTQISNVWDELGKGYFSFYISGPWNIGEFKRRLPPAQQGSWMTAPMPGPDGPGVSSAGGSSLVIFRRSQHKASAWALIEYLSRPEVQRRFYEITGDLPPRRSSWESGTIATDPYTRAFRIQLERLRVFQQLPEWEQIMQGMRLMAERVVRGGQSEATAVTDFDAEVDAMLAKRRWLLDRQEKR